MTIDGANGLHKRLHKAVEAVEQAYGKCADMPPRVAGPDELHNFFVEPDPYFYVEPADLPPVDK